MAQDFDSAFERLDAYLEGELKAFNAPGIAVGITDRHRLLGIRVCGWANLAQRESLRPDHLFEIGSIGKSFTSILALQLHERGMLDLHAAVTRYLPWFSVESEFEPITPHHLLSHTAGIIKGSDETSGSASEVWNIRRTRAAAPPGTYFHYSNSGYKILGLILEAVLDRPYPDILREGILEPLAMEATDALINYRTRERLTHGHEAYFDDRPTPCGARLQPATWLETDTADGSIASNAEDMCRFLRCLLSRGEGLISEPSFDLLIQPVIRMSEEEDSGFYGYGLDIEEFEGDRCLAHGGGMVGYRTHMKADLDAGLGIVILTNGPADPETLAPYALRLFRAALAGTALPDVPPPVDPYAVEGADDYVGTYKSEAKGFTIRSDHGRLTLEMGGERVLLEHRPPRGFIAGHAALELFLLRFRTSDGQIVEAIHGPDVFVRQGHTGSPAKDAPAAWQSYPGHYRSHNPWYSNFRVVLRQGSLILIYPDGDEDPLIPLDDRTFRLGEDPQSPEYVRFEALIDGRTHLAELSGGSYSRTFAP